MTWSGMTLVGHDLVRHHVVRVTGPGPGSTWSVDGAMTTMTSSGLAAAMRKFRLGPAQRIMLLTATVAAAAVALFVIVVRSLPEAPTAVTLPWVLWAAAFAVCEALVVHVQWQREAHTFSVGDLVLAAGLLLATPQRPGARPGGGRRRHAARSTGGSAGIKLAFNVALYALGGSLATGVFALTSELSAPGTGWPRSSPSW